MRWISLRTSYLRNEPKNISTVAFGDVLTIARASLNNSIRLIYSNISTFVTVLGCWKRFQTEYQSTKCVQNEKILCLLKSWFLLFFLLETFIYTGYRLHKLMFWLVVNQTSKLLKVRNCTAQFGRGQIILGLGLFCENGNLSSQKGLNQTF